MRQSGHLHVERNRNKAVLSSSTIQLDQKEKSRPQKGKKHGDWRCKRKYLTKKILNLQGKVRKNPNGGT